MRRNGLRAAVMAGVAASGVAAALASDIFIGCNTWKWIEVHLQTGKSPVYRYSFDRKIPVPPDNKVMGVAATSRAFRPPPLGRRSPPLGVAQGAVTDIEPRGAKAASAFSPTPSALRPTPSALRPTPSPRPCPTAGAAHSPAPGPR